MAGIHELDYLLYSGPEKTHIVYICKYFFGIPEKILEKWQSKNCLLKTEQPADVLIDSLKIQAQLHVCLTKA